MRAARLQDCAGVGKLGELDILLKPLHDLAEDSPVDGRAFIFVLAYIITSQKKYRGTHWSKYTGLAVVVYRIDSPLARYMETGESGPRAVGNR